MGKANFKDSDKFQIVNYINGKESRNKVNIKFLDNNEVILNNNLLGNIKLLGPGSNKFVCYEIASLLDINIAECLRIVNSKDQEALFVKNDITKEEMYIGMDFIFKKVFDKYNENNLGDGNWISNSLNLPNNTLLDTDNYIKVLIDTGINAVRDSFSLSSDNYNSFRRDYIRMIFFDYVISNNSRSVSDYGIVLNNLTKEIRMAPIGVNYIIRDIEEYTFNNRMVKRSKFIEVLYKYYYDDFKDLSRGLVDHYITYLESIKAICKYNLSDAQAKKIIDIVRNNLKTIEELELSTSGSLEKVNKIEDTQLSIRINQGVMKKNLVVMSKYPMDKLKEEIEESNEESIKIIFEEKSKFNIFVFIGVILVIALVVSYFLFR